ncbi:MAG: hypothetical protein ACI93T_001804 [Porticoccaceae bacterium]|jgi:hypothetical protein
MNDLTRRVFLGQAGATAMAGAAMAGESHSSHVNEADKFRPHVGQTFRISPDGKTWTNCVLDEVNDLGPAPRPHLPKPASLIFRTADGATLPQDTYIVSHNQLSVTRLLMAPVERDQRLEVVFG